MESGLRTGQSEPGGWRRGCWGEPGMPQTLGATTATGWAGLGQVAGGGRCSVQAHFVPVSGVWETWRGGGGGAGGLDREPLEVDGGREGGPEAGGQLMLLRGVAPLASAPFCEDLRVSGDETLTLFAADGGTAG